MYFVQEMQKLTLVNGGDVGTFQNCNRNELNNLVGTYFAESFLKKKTLFFFQIDENHLNNLSGERRSSRVKIGNSFTSVIESSDASLYSTDERRNSSRLGPYFWFELFSIQYWSKIFLKTCVFLSCTFPVKCPPSFPLTNLTWFLQSRQIQCFMRRM